MAEVSWMLKGAEYANCNCAWGCPCQFNALPTNGNCQYVIFARIDDGYYAKTRLDGLGFVVVGEFPGAVHEGNGTQQLIIEERADDKQREAIRRIVYNEDTDELRTQKNPVTGEEHRAQIVLPGGFEYTVAEMGSGSTKTEGEIRLEFSDTYAQFNELNFTEKGIVR